MTKKTPPKGVAVFLGLAALWTTSCQAPHENNEQNEPSESSSPVEPVTNTWVSTTLDVHILQSMLEHDQSGAVVENIRGFYEEFNETREGQFDGYQILLDSGVISEEGGEYEVETDSSRWGTGEHSSITDSQVRQAVRDSVIANQVDWCGEEMSGYEFSENYLDANEGQYDTREEYESSIEEYVNCKSE
ncbi:hypothetical protein AB0I72_01880 [Nocardiopsis sp. NPDC049922]|uniref:hypothetical protein n=1 Tax=Nocardiopsis sp. NPDC049922 TaxID=3155157 RepID=UPI00340D3B66